MWSKAQGAGTLKVLSESTFASLKTVKTVGAPSTWSKRVVPILLMSNGCVLDIACNKPIRVSSPFPFKSQLLLRHGEFDIYMAKFASAKTEGVSREETDLLVRKQIGRLILIHAMTIHYDMQAFLYLCSLHNNNLLHCNPLIFNILACLCAAACPCV